MFITTVVNAHEGWNVAMFDTLSVKSYAEKGEDIIMLLKGELSDLMMKVAPNIYQKYVIIISKGELLLYVHIQGELYVLLWRLFQFYINLAKDLDACGFQINHYGTCVKNKMINDH